MTAADVCVILIAVSLPWSVTLVAVFAVAWLVAMAPLLELSAFLQSLKRPISALPVALFVLAAVGTLWSDAAWGVRLYAVGPTVKMLALPLLFFHFERSRRGAHVLWAFLLSCTLLLAMSWIVAIEPALALKRDATYGVPVKNYIDQSQEFALCAVALAFPIVTLWRTGRTWLAAALAAVALSFVVNMTFVVVSRTALVTMPIMLAVFAILHLRWRSIVIILCALTVLAGLAWATSPHLRSTGHAFVRDYRLYSEENVPTSIGNRLQFWQKSLRFLGEAPLFGHGTGSTRGLFEHAAIGQTGAAAEVISNPHNQTLYAAVQWGVIGVAVLIAMWLVHLRLFRGDGLEAWIGLLVVVQNIFTSLFNSHLFDFHEGWMYVLGVGVAGGMLLRRRAGDRPGNEKLRSAIKAGTPPADGLSAALPRQHRDIVWSAK